MDPLVEASNMEIVYRTPIEGHRETFNRGAVTSLEHRDTIGHGIEQGRGNDFFSWGGGKNVDMPSDCQHLGGGTQAYPSH